MKARQWMMTLIVAFTSTALVAQSGISTMEGVPVVEEIVTDSNTTDVAEAVVKTAAKVGTWRVTTYVNDSIDSTETLEFTEEIFEDMPDFFKGIFGLTGLSIASGTILLVFIILFCIFGLPLILLFVLFYLILRKRKPNASVSTSQATDTQDASKPDRALFNKGVKNICLGIGLAIFFGLWMGDFGVGIGILVICIGIGELIVDYFARK